MFDNASRYAESRIRVELFRRFASLNGNQRLQTLHPNGHGDASIYLAAGMDGGAKSKVHEHFCGFQNFPELKHARAELRARSR